MTDDITYPRASYYPRQDRDGEYWVDFTAWKPVEGAKRGPLYIDGNRTKTSDEMAATRAFVALEKTMQERWRKHHSENVSGSVTEANPKVRTFAKNVHFPAKQGSVEPSSLNREIRAVKVVLRTSGAELRIKTITPLWLQEYVQKRRAKGMKASTILKELSAISELCKTAVEHEIIESNPVRKMRRKPSPDRGERVFLENDQAGDLIIASRRHDASATGRATRFMEPLLSTMVVQGCRNEEGRGTLRRDVDLERGIFHIRPNDFRGLKKSWHRRSMRLWPQTRSAMERHLLIPDPKDPSRMIERFAPDEPIFPGTEGGIIQDVRSSFWSILVDAGIASYRDPDDRSLGIDESITFHTLRHTYCAARLQTTDRGAPIQQHTVMTEMGHRDYKLIAEIYGHVQHRAPRGEEVIYLPSEDSEADDVLRELEQELERIERAEQEASEAPDLEERLEAAFGAD